MKEGHERSTPPLELWGGVECTVVRLGDQYRDQVVETGHSVRLADLDAIAELGIRTVRYPIMWERVAPDDPEQLDFAWHDERLRRLRELGIRVIGGLVHHGSGPRYTSLLDPEFPDKLADYAGRVAERYPWIDMWTPVNEPLTTARFSGLYGHWYPHRHDEAACLRALANECVATIAATNHDYTVLANIAGLAAVSVPEKTVDGLPVGIQAIGRDDGLVLGVAAELT